MSESSQGPDRLLSRLARRRSPEPRYEVVRQIGQGGMGTVLEAVDLDLRRRLAIKVLKDRDGQRAGDVDPALVHRFVEEAQVGAQLSHPGVVPVHELGLDPDGGVYFSMALVQGQSLEDIYPHVFAASEGWSLTRVLGVLQRVCETMAYAHSRGVIHRDLKPANVMVGAFGEVYVMDWGLAKVLGEASPAGAGLPATAALRTDRRESVESDPDSSIASRMGAVVGTPAYMSPEQARGGELDERSDVYAVGAMLYTLLAGRRPYAGEVGRDPKEIVLAIREESPASVARLAPHAPAELVAICEKAMARDPAARYADMAALAADLRAYLENRVVRAHRTGAWVELVKWVRRNRALAIALAGAVLVALAGTGAYAWKERQRAETERIGLDRVLRLADAKELRELKAELDELWPPSPAMAPRLANWLDRLGAVSRNRAQHEATRAELAARSLGTDPGPAATKFQAAGLWFAASEDAWWCEAVAELLKSLTEAEALRPGVESRRAFAASVRERTIGSAEARARWDAVIADIAALPVYRGLRLAPQLGLLPLGRDPASGLWEFWHVQSGAEPVRDEATLRWRIEGETGIVLVLLPGGTCSIGSKPMTVPPGTPWDSSWDDDDYRMAVAFAEWEQPWYDPGHTADERFIERVELDPFFVAKHELTQGQWLKLFGSNPSQNALGPAHPIENVDWDESARAASRLALALPTEAQWEYACRAGTTSPFWTGWSLESLQGRANLADRALDRHLGGTGRMQFTREIDDGFAGHAPVGSFEPNPFGLLDAHGNVWEWCADSGLAERAPRSGDGLCPALPGDESRAFRGGAWTQTAIRVRSANRFMPPTSRTTKDGDLGLRLARPIDP